MFTPKIYPVSATMVSLDNLVRGSMDTIGYSPLRGVDAMKRELSVHARYVAAIAGMHDRLDTERPLEALRDARMILDHLHFGFLIQCDQQLILNIRERTKLTLTHSEGSSKGVWVAICSGTLSEYRVASIDCCHPSAPFELIYLFDQIVMFFEKIGLGDIWFDYRKVTQYNHTFLLEEK